MDMKRILLATDFSEGSEAAVPYAVDLAKKYGAKIYFLHVLYDITLNMTWYATQISTDKLYEEMHESALREMDRIIRDCFGGFSDVEKVVKRGSPSDDILEFAKTQAIDIIVMSSHGRRGLNKALFGSTAARIVRDARCPVLTVRISEGCAASEKGK